MKGMKGKKEWNEKRVMEVMERKEVYYRERRKEKKKKDSPSRLQFMCKDRVP